LATCQRLAKAEVCFCDRVRAANTTPDLQASRDGRGWLRTSLLIGCFHPSRGADRGHRPHVSHVLAGDLDFDSKPGNSSHEGGTSFREGDFVMRRAVLIAATVVVCALTVGPMAGAVNPHEIAISGTTSTIDPGTGNCVFRGPYVLDCDSLD